MPLPLERFATCGLPEGDLIDVNDGSDCDEKDEYVTEEMTLQNNTSKQTKPLGGI